MLTHRPLLQLGLVYEFYLSKDRAMIKGFDHLIFWVNDCSQLDEVCTAFSQAGFTISERLDAGREHAPNRQKLICFRDDSYIEILTVQEPDARLKHRLHKIGQHGDGWADFCLEVENAEIEMVRVCAANLPVKGPTTHSKFLENGKEWGVKLLNTGIGIGHPVLPFMVEDTVGRNLRIPQSGLDHANGAVGIGGVRLAVDDLDLAVDHMSRLLNLTAILTPAWDEPHAGQRFKLRSGHWIDLFSPAPRSSQLRSILEKRGEGIFSAVLLGHENVPISLYPNAKYGHLEIVA